MSKHSIHQIGDVFVSSRAARTLLLAIAIAATGAGVFALTHGATAVPQASAGSKDIAVPLTAAIPVLPAVVVEAEAAMPVLPTVMARVEAAIPILPTVTVRADRPAHPAQVERDDGVEPSLVAVEQDLHMLATGTTTGGGYDMPYYSFGKTLRRLNKE